MLGFVLLKLMHMLCIVQRRGRRSCALRYLTSVKEKKLVLASVPGAGPRIVSLAEICIAKVGSLSSW